MAAAVRFVFSDSAFSDMVFSDMVFSDIVRSDIVRSDIVRSDIVCSDIVCSDVRQRQGHCQRHCLPALMLAPSRRWPIRWNVSRSMLSAIPVTEPSQKSAFTEPL